MGPRLISQMVWNVFILLFSWGKRAFIFMTSCRMWLYKKTYDQIRLALPWWRSALHWGRSILIIENLNGEAEPSCAGRRCGQTAISPPGVWRPGDRLENNSFKFWHGDPLYIPSPRPTLCPPALPDKTRHETDKAGWNYSTHLVQSLLRGGGRGSTHWPHYTRYYYYDWCAVSMTCHMGRFKMLKVKFSPLKGPYELYSVT